MEKVWSALGRLATNAILIILCAVFHWIPTTYIILYAVGIVFLTISVTLMEDSNEIARMVVFLIAAGFLLIPSFVLNIIDIVHKEGTLMSVAFFAISASVVFASWYCVGADNGIADNILDLAGPYYAFLVAVILRFIFGMSAYVQAILFLVAGLILMGVLLILRMTRGSVFYY